MAKTRQRLVRGPSDTVQWVLSLPFALRYLLATRPEVVTQVLGIVLAAERDGISGDKGRL